MQRGKPLYLNQERYAALSHMVTEIFISPLFDISCEYCHDCSRCQSLAHLFWVDMRVACNCFFQTFSNVAGKN